MIVQGKSQNSQKKLHVILIGIRLQNLVNGSDDFENI